MKCPLRHFHSARWGSSKTALARREDTKSRSLFRAHEDHQGVRQELALYLRGGFQRNLARILGLWFGGNHGKLRTARPTGVLAHLPVRPLVGSTDHGSVYQITSGGVEDNVLSSVESGNGDISSRAFRSLLERTSDGSFPEGS